MARESRASPQLDGERRHLTVMFTDLVDFTVMGESLGEESVFALTRRIASEQGQSIQSNGGVVQDFAGDGLMAVFGAPVAMEDAALRACRTALDIQERMYRLQDEFQASYGVKPLLRIGIHTGPAVVGKIGEGKTMSYSALGDTVNVASRLQAAADPGSVCITRATLDVVEGFVDATPLGERQFKGKAQPTEIYRLDAVRSGLTRFGAKRRHGLTQLRGRDVELALLHEHWNVVKAGRFRPVNVIGDAGLGKSRLIFEFTETLREQPVLLLEAICRPEGAAIPFMPLIEVMRRWFGIPEEGVPRDLAEAKLSQGLDRLKIERESSLPYLLNLVTGSSSANASLAAMPASELVGVRTREALRKFILRLCKSRPAGGAGGRGFALDRHRLARRARRGGAHRERRAAAADLQLPPAIRADLDDARLLRRSPLERAHQCDRHRDHQGAAGGEGAARGDGQARRYQVGRQSAVRRGVRQLSLA